MAILKFGPNFAVVVIDFQELVEISLRCDTRLSGNRPLLSVTGAVQIKKNTTHNDDNRVPGAAGG